MHLGRCSSCPSRHRDGDIAEISDQSRHLLRAAQVSMGMLGVMTEVTLEVVPRYELHERAYFMPVAEVVERWDDLLHSHRHFSFHYLPNRRSLSLYSEQLPKHPSRGETALGKAPLPDTGTASRVLPRPRSVP
jgi:hypothetical protein